MTKKRKNYTKLLTEFILLEKSNKFFVKWVGKKHENNTWVKKNKIKNFDILY